jgi:hypothetical protein
MSTSHREFGPQLARQQVAAIAVENKVENKLGFGIRTLGLGA